MKLPNKDYDSTDAFHKELAAMIAKYGRGTLTAVYWSNWADPDTSRSLHGMAICELQYGLLATPFEVVTTASGYVLSLRARRVTIRDPLYFQQREESGVDMLSRMLGLPTPLNSESKSE